MIIFICLDCIECTVDISFDCTETHASIRLRHAWQPVISRKRLALLDQLAVAPSVLFCSGFLCMGMTKLYVAKSARQIDKWPSAFQTCHLPVGFWNTDTWHCSVLIGILKRVVRFNYESSATFLATFT